MSGDLPYYARLPLGGDPIDARPGETVAFKCRSAQKHHLDLHDLRAANLERDRSSSRAVLESWTIPELALLFLGEAGSLAHKLSDRTHGTEVPTLAIADRIGDCLVTLDLLAAMLRIDLAEATVRAFNRASGRWGIRLKVAK